MITKPIRERLDQEKLIGLIDEGFTWITTARVDTPARILFHTETAVTVEYPVRPELPRVIGYPTIRAVHKPIEEDQIP